MDALRALLLAMVLVAAAVPVGAVALRGCGLHAKDFTGESERWLWSAGLGLGVQAWTLTLLGLAGLFYSVVVLALPFALALISLPFCMVHVAFRPPPLHRWSPVAVVVLAGLALLAAARVVQDLAPPTDYDGLLYHLVAPQIFLDAHRIVYLPHNFSANLPAFGEMLFAFGLAGGSDRAPQLIHAAAGALCVALTYTLGRRYVPRAALLGAAALAATPLTIFLATRAYIDLFTVLFGLLAVSAALHWWNTGRVGWVLAGAVGAGFALETKYAAATLLLVLGALLLWLRPPGCTWKRRLAAAAGFGAVAGIVALPWYVRQVVTLGNPVWPMYLGGRDWDQARVAQLTYFVEHYGAGRRLRDWLLLPWNLYRESWRFGHVPQSYPPLLAPAAPLALLARRGPALHLLLVCAGSFVLWARGWQDLRFLAGIYPLLALLGATGLEAILPAKRYRSAVLGLLAAGLVWAAVWPAARGALDAAGVVAGREPAADYLRRKLPDQRAIELLNAQLPPGGAALFLGDGQIWYCRTRCLPDPAHDNLLIWFVRPGSPSRSLALLQQEGVTHILLSKRDYWYLEHQDPQSRLNAQLAAFYVFKAAYLDLVYEDALTEVYRGRW